MSDTSVRICSHRWSLVRVHSLFVLRGAQDDNAFISTNAPDRKVRRSVTPGAMPAALPAPLLPLLVLPSDRSLPLCPFDVASTLGGTVAVFMVFVNAVVGNVAVVLGSDSAAASSVSITSAKPGAGTVMAHVPALVSHCTVWICSSPRSRPSDSNLPPKVYKIINKYEAAVT